MKWSLFVFILLLSGLMPLLVSAADQTPVYSNEDIEKYRNPSDSRAAEKRRRDTADTKKEAAGRFNAKKDQEHWCRRGTDVRKKIEIYRRDVKEKEQDIAREEAKTVRTSRKVPTLQSRLRKAKERLASAEIDLTDLENEAHRKGIPPGWLRCQFE